MGEKIREALKLRFDKRLRLEPMAEMPRVVWEVLSRIDNRMRLVHHWCRDQRGTRSAHYELKWGIPAE